MLTRFAIFALRQHGGKGWDKVARIPKGQPGGGRWTSGGSALDKWMAGDDPFDAKGRSQFHDRWLKLAFEYSTPDEIQAILAYADGDYATINKYARTGKAGPAGGKALPKYFDKKMELLDSYIDRWVAPENFITYRGTHLIMDENHPTEEYNALVQTLLAKSKNPEMPLMFSDKGYLSTSTDVVTANKFTPVYGPMSGAEGIHYLHFEIRVPKGTHCAPNAREFENILKDSEYEVVFGRNQKFNVISVKATSGTSWNKKDDQTFDIVMEAIQ